MSKKPNRIDLYLQQNTSELYVNTDKENELLAKFIMLFNIAKNAHDVCEQCKPENLSKWRKAYLGTLRGLDKDGQECTRETKQLRKMAFEIIESKVDNGIPMPKIQPRYKSDLPLVSITENYLKFEVDRIMTKFVNDKSERSTYIDGTGWYKAWWDSLDNTHERSGNVKIDFCTVDQIIPQPGVSDYKQLEYIFEIKKISVSKIYDLYDRVILPISEEGNNVEVISCYYLNENHIVGLFSWARYGQQVICNEKDWQIRKLRTCQTCHEVNPTGDVCMNCGGTSFKYENAKEEILDKDLLEIYNPYEAGENVEEDKKDEFSSRVFLSAGTSIPFYQITQLPFIPRPAISSVDSIYGLSEVMIVMDMQDSINKILTKAVDKTLKSGAVLTKQKNTSISDTDDTIKIVTVKTAEEAASVTCKQIMADTSQDMLMCNMIYDSGKASSGITDSFQGAEDNTATSGKAKQYSALQSAGRIESLRVMKAAAFSGLYELILKFLLAFSDERRRFVRVLPDGTETEETWNKYMFLDKGKYGEIYYRDDLQFNSDSASTLSQNRVGMWQETMEKFTMGAFGDPLDPRTLKLFWNTMDSLQYPLSKIALAGIKETEQHLPPEIEKLIMENPEVVQELIAQTQENRGGARSNSGPEGNGATHAANVSRTNKRDASQIKNEAFSAQQGATAI